MKAFHLIISLGIVAVLIWLNRIDAHNAVTMYGGLSWIGWASIAIVVFGICVLILANDSARAAAVRSDNVSRWLAHQGKTIVS